jgi:peptidase M23-like protein
MRRLLLLLIVFFVPAAPADAAWVWPVHGDVITPYRNGTDPYAAGQHRGIDIAAAVGTEVVAAAGGDVRFAGTAGSSGLTISIRTSDGYDTSYLHLSSLAVRAGARVSAGDRIGAVGTTGTRSATAPHLHFGVRDAGTDHSYHDPLAFLPAPPGAPSPEPPAPAPAPEPAPPAPAPLTPTPAARPRTAPVRRPAPAPRLPRPLPAPEAHPRLATAPAPTPSRRLLPQPARPHPARAGAPHAVSHRQAAVNGHDARQRSPFATAGSKSSGARHRALSSPRSAHATPAGAGTSASDGPDIAWALACGGLLLAAALLGLTDDGRRSTRRARFALARLRAPLPRG